jgi:predicted phosphodiesterase
MEGIFEDSPDDNLIRHWMDIIGADILITGHTHNPLFRKIPGDTIVLNPGSALMNPMSPKHAELACGTFAVIEIPSRCFRVYSIATGEILMERKG